MANKLTSKVNAKAIVSLIPTVVFACFILTMAIATSTNKDVQDAITSTELSAESLEELSDTFEEALQDNIYQKNNYINLNGLSTRLLGINTLNERYKLANGYLATDENGDTAISRSTSVIELNDFLSDREMDFLYVLVPSKQAFYDAEFLPGYESTAWMTIDNMIDALNEAGVNNLNMNAWFEENDWDIEDVFFKTDHHWMPQAGLEAARATMEILTDKGIAYYDKELLDEDNWDVTVYENWFLGSDGKRVGIYYTGLDDIAVYTPNFEIDYTYSRLTTGTTNWSYSNSLLNLTYTEDKDYFGSNPYCIYLYGDNPLQIIKNSNASNDMRVLVIGDSFNLTWRYFLSTQFTEIYSMDLRYYTDGACTEFIEEIQPDLVIMCVNSNDSYEYSFGISDYSEALEATDENTEAVELGNFALDADSDNKNSFTVVYTELESGQTYTLTADSTDYSGGSDLFIQMTLQDLSTNTAIYNRYFDANNDETQKWIFDVPDSDDTYAIYLYAGTKGHTSGVSAGVTGITLYEGIIEW